VGRNWAGELTREGSLFMDRVANFRRQLAQDLGLVLPRVRFKDMARLSPDQYEICVDGVVVGRGEARRDRWLAIHPSGHLSGVPGEPTRDPTYNLPALWVEAQHREAATAARCTLVDAQTVLMTHLTEALKREAATLMTRAETERLLQRVRETQPTLVEELIPTVLGVSDVQRVLQQLLREKVSIRHLEAILETLADAGRGSKDPGVLTERVRQRLGPAICQTLLGDARALQVLTLAPAVESQFVRGLQDAGASATPLDPRLVEQFIGRLVQQAERMVKSNLVPVLLCSPELRRHLRAVSERVLPHLRILSMNEVPSTVELKSFAVVAATTAATSPSAVAGAPTAS